MRSFNSKMVRLKENGNIKINTKEKSFNSKMVRLKDECSQSKCGWKV